MDYFEVVRTELGQSEVDEVGDDLVDRENVLAGVDEALTQLERKVRKQQVLLDRMLKELVEPFNEVRDVDHFDENGKRKAEQNVAQKSPSVGPSAMLRKRRDEHLPSEFGLVDGRNVLERLIRQRSVVFLHLFLGFRLVQSVDSGIAVNQVKE